MRSQIKTGGTRSWRSKHADDRLELFRSELTLIVMNMPGVPDHVLDRVFAALSDSTRRAILARLRNGEASVAELAEPFDMTTRAVSRHIAVLEAAGLVTRSRDAQRRPSRISTAPLEELDRWLGDYRVLWSGRFDKLNERLKDGMRENDKR
jgi:DNA-binding transcriptional ArsR family regulator